MPSFTRQVEYQNDFYSTEITVYDEFDEEFDIGVEEFFNECDTDDMAEFLDLIVNKGLLADVLNAISHETRLALTGVTSESPTPTAPPVGLNLGATDIQRIPPDWIAEYTTSDQVLQLLIALAFGRHNTLIHVWERMSQATRDSLITSLGFPGGQPSREPVEDALELLSDIDRNRLLGLPDTTLDHLRSLLSEA